MSRTVQRYGWKPSLPDLRDLHADTSTLPIKAEVDPRKALPSVYDQGQLGSCTGNAIAAAVAYHLGVNWTPSRLDIYYGERMLEGTVDQDSGAFGRDGFKYAHSTGVIDEAAWPYDIATFTKPPATVAKAQRTKIGAYRAVPRSMTDFKRVLSNGQTIAFGFSVYESFESAQVARSGIVPLPGPGEKQLGGHEVLAVGYLKAHPQHVLVRNSWSPSWGMAGYCLMPWAMLLDPGMSSDFRTIYRPSA